jgi:hypothetical protein
MKARQLLIAGGIIGLVLAYLAFFSWQAARHYHRPRLSNFHYTDLRSAKEAGAVASSRFPSILPASSTNLNVWFKEESELGGSFTFPVQDLPALKERARQVSGAVINDSPSKASVGAPLAMITYSDQGNAFEIVISPLDKDPGRLYGLWERKPVR